MLVGPVFLRRIGPAVGGVVGDLLVPEEVGLGRGFHVVVGLVVRVIGEDAEAHLLQSFGGRNVVDNVVGCGVGGACLTVAVALDVGAEADAHVFIVRRRIDIGTRVGAGGDGQQQRDDADGTTIQ